MEGGLLSVPLEAEVFEEVQILNEDHQSRTGLRAGMTGSIGRNVGYSFAGGLFLESGTSSDVFPRWTTDYPATIEYEAKQAGKAAIPVGPVIFDSYGNLTGMLTYGNDELYAQAGLVRSSFGPAVGSTVVGAQAPQAGHFSATLRLPWLTQTAAFFELMALKGIHPEGDVYNLKQVDIDVFPSKYLIIHSTNIHPLPWLEVGIFQTIMFGRRISPIYFLPVPLFAQAYIGDWDNAFIGGNLKIDFPFLIRWNTMLYVDDLHASRLVKLDFDTNGHKVALQTGLEWIAPVTMPNHVTVEYLAVLPYMYTHNANQPVNYMQYTHLGKHLGSVLEPNSDQISAAAFIQPIPEASVELWFKRLRHGNGSDYGEGSIDGDGSVYDDGYEPYGGATFLDTSSFLTQETLEVVTQAGLKVVADIDIGPMELSARVGYTLELVKNRDLNPDAPDETNHIVSLELAFGL